MACVSLPSGRGYFHNGAWHAGKQPEALAPLRTTARSRGHRAGYGVRGVHGGSWQSGGGSSSSDGQSWWSSSDGGHWGGWQSGGSSWWGR